MRRELACAGAVRRRRRVIRHRRPRAGFSKTSHHHDRAVAPDANEHAPEVLQQLVTRDVEKYRKLLEEK
jgi:hypothetical protein